mgnify:CR=1 FL=1
MKTRNGLFADVPENLWNDWHWQVANRAETIEDLKKYMNLTPDEEAGVAKTLGKLRMAVTPYYLSLIDLNDPFDPIRKMAIPRAEELEYADYEDADPLHEDTDSPTPGLTHRYPDRVLLLITDQCSMYCRHCTRRRFAGQNDCEVPMAQIDKCIDYVAAHPEVRDVLLSGGDSLMVSDETLEYIIKRVRAIPHVEIVRLGSRTPVVCPQRITPELCAMLKKYHPVWLNTHFNTPKEFTPEAAKACAMLADAGIPLGNQSVLLAGVNDCSHVMMELVQGEGGVLPLDRDYVKAVARLCAEKDWLLLVDEVQTGVGRTGSLFAFQQYGILPDVASFAKGIAGGLPMSGILANEKCRDVLGPGTHATTFGANPVCAAAGLVVQETLTDAFLEDVRAKGTYLRNQIEALDLPCFGATRGMGLMIGIQVKDGWTNKEIASKLIENGLLVLTAGPGMRLLPPLVISQEEMDQGLEILKKTLS